MSYPPHQQYNQPYPPVPPQPAPPQTSVPVGGRSTSSRAKTALTQQLLAAGLVIAGIATLLALMMQWPPSDPLPVSENYRQNTALTGDLAQGTVAFVQPGPCNSPSLGTVFDSAPTINQYAEKRCSHAIIDLTSGSDSGKRTILEVHPEIPGNPNLQVGDRIELSRHTGPTGEPMYAFQDFQRATALWLWLGAAVLLIVLVGAGRGARALVGLVLTLAAIVVFLIPGLAHGGSPVGLAVTTGAAVLFLVLFLVHGVSWKTASAMGGTLTALGIAALLSSLAVSSTGIRGLGDENNLNILVYMPGISITGLMLAGMIVGSLGVLNDVTIAQASTVTELHELNPDAKPWTLVRSAMRVGRDHIASMVYTLVLSYTGVAIPTLLLLSASGRPLMQILTSDVMATEILRSLTGAAALVLAVPITTVIAAWTVPRRASAPAPAVPSHRSTATYPPAGSAAYLDSHGFHTQHPGH